MSEEIDDIRNEVEDDLEFEVAEQQDPVRSAKFNKVLQAEDTHYSLPGMYKDWFLDYASYVMLDRAVPYIEDGLKPVQRRILHALKINEDGRYHKVAGIVGDTMKFHPHGDASIYDALVGIQQKELIIDGQGNWGNILTGDGAAAMRYIECKLSKFALDVVYSPKITEWVKTYDRANDEPVTLPVKFPLLLAHGSKGIGVGLKILVLPHNFNELLDASIDVLRGKEINLYPDFQTGGIADCSKYNGGLRGGRIRVRATISKRDKRTLVIEDIPYGETTDSVKSSIAAACEKGKIKIKKFDDYTSDKVEIVLQLHNDISPDKTIDALYAFTKCAVTISPNTVVIKDGRPEFMTVNDVLRFNTFHTRDLLLQELNVQLCELEEDWHRTSLEKIFFEKKVYRVLENDARSWDDQVDDVTSRMLEYQHLVHRSITKDDILKLVEKPVRKISKFDIKSAEDLLANIETKIEKVKYNIEHITEYAIEHFKTLKKKYGAKYPRHTRIEEFEDIQVQTVAATNAKLYANRTDGFVGTDAKKIDGAEYICDCSDIDAVIAFMKNGDYIVTDVKDKAFIGKDIIHVAIFKKGDERTVYNAIYRDGKDGIYYAKRFAITGITKNKLYNLTIGTAGSTVIWFTANANGEAETVRVQLRPRPKLKKLIDFYDFSALGVKGRASRGNVVSRNPVQRITLKSKGVSTIGGKPIWFDNDINRLNDAQRGLYLGEFEDGEHILTILKNGHFYTTSFDLSNRYQGDIKIIEKLDADTTWSALYFDKESGFFYLKRFSFEVSDNTDQCFIAESNGSYLVELSRDVYPQVKVTFTGKNASREPEIIDVAEFIGKKGFKAKGKRVSSYEVGSVEFIEPLPVPKVEIEEESAAEEATLTDMQKEEMQGEEPMSQPVVEAPLKVKKIAWEAEGEIAPAGETEEDDSEASPKGEGGTIELTLF